MKKDQQVSRLSNADRGRDHCIIARHRDPNLLASRRAATKLGPFPAQKQ